jgi:hypothetical protein
LRFKEIATSEVVTNDVSKRVKLLIKNMLNNNENDWKKSGVLRKIGL